MTNDNNQLMPYAQRRVEDTPGHWLLAKLGKRVLRPGGLGLTRRMLEQADIEGVSVVELAPGLGRTATEILRRGPSSYVGVERDERAAELTATVVGSAGKVVHADAANTGLPGASVEVVLGEAMLSMQSDAAKRAIVAEAARLLRPGGRYAIHELGLCPDDLDPAVKSDLRKELARVIKVNARPQTMAEWRSLLEESGLVVDWTDTAPMALLTLRRNLADEGPRGVLRIIRNVLGDPDARGRVLALRSLFRRHREHLCGVALVAHRPGTGEVGSGAAHRHEPAHERQAVHSSA